ncbi:hypothetical protein [Streptomyces toxytricini]|uniref:hypothetical protein n=1 Tax=Streptomyces toxytricini TaxID=67369 RepID=UPI0034361CF8
MLCVHHAFRTADVHEVLPPLLSPVVVLVMSVLHAFDGPAGQRPAGRLVRVPRGRAALGTALSAWELRRLRTRYGTTLRRALGRRSR